MRYRHLFIQDIGGQTTAEGKKVRKGFLYRSGDLYRLKPRELAALEKLGIRMVIDLRQEEVARRRPGSFQAEKMVFLPVRLGEFGELTLRAALRQQPVRQLY